VIVMLLGCWQTIMGVYTCFMWPSSSLAARSYQACHHYSADARSYQACHHCSADASTAANRLNYIVFSSAFAICVSLIV